MISCLPYDAAYSSAQATCSMLQMICLMAELGSIPAKERGREVLLDHQLGKYIHTFDQDRLAKRVCIGTCQGHQTHANTSMYMLQNFL